MHITKKQKQKFNFCFCFLLNYLFFHHSADLETPNNIFLIPQAMAMQIGKNGVKGPAQKARQAVATARHHLKPNNAKSR